MSELRIEREAMEAGALRLRLEGVLDGGGAYLLRDRITSLAQPVVVDFSRLERLSDFGLGILGMAICELDLDVQLVGLGNHAQRILRAFGIAAAA
ncbi:STAS domain-containing protein [Vulgatibacter incomptus]|nr:STAS domain-containing protein [Vulgatibacter incomptus]